MSHFSVDEYFKTKPRMNGYPASRNQMNPQGNPGEIGQD